MLTKSADARAHVTVKARTVKEERFRNITDISAKRRPQKCTEVFGAFLVHRDRSDVIEDADVCVKLVSACPMSSKPQPFVRKPVCFVGFLLFALRGGCAHVTLKVFEEERHRMSVL